MAAQFVTADGMLLADVAMPGEPDTVHVLHKPGLIHEYVGRAQTERDFADGLFRLYL